MMYINSPPVTSQVLPEFRWESLQINLGGFTTESFVKVIVGVASISDMLISFRPSCTGGVKGAVQNGYGNKDIKMHFMISFIKCPVQLISLVYKELFAMIKIMSEPR